MLTRNKTKLREERGTRDLGSLGWYARMDGAVVGFSASYVFNRNSGSARDGGERWVPHVSGLSD